MFASNGSEEGIEANAVLGARGDDSHVAWGRLSDHGRDLLRVAPWVSFAPGIAIGLAVLGFNLVGDALREIYDPRLRTDR